MPDIPLLSGKKIIKMLIKHFDFFVVSQKGSHIKLHKNIDGRTITTIVPNHKELARGTLRGILELAEVSIEGFIKYI